MSAMAATPADQATHALLVQHQANQVWEQTNGVGMGGMQALWDDPSSLPSIWRPTGSGSPYCDERHRKRALLSGNWHTTWPLKQAINAQAKGEKSVHFRSLGKASCRKQCHWIWLLSSECPMAAHRCYTSKAPLPPSHAPSIPAVAFCQL